MLDIILSIENDEERKTAEEIWERYQQHMQMIASKILKNPCDADDAVMDAIRCVVKSIHKFVGLGDMDVICLVTVYTKNSAFKIYNKNKTKSNNVLNIDDYDGEDTSADVEDMVIAQDEYGKAVSCLESMPEIYSHTFILRHYYGWSIRDITAYLDLTEANVKKRLNRAKQMLKKLMESSDD